jgi:hypothetical protein
MLSDGHSEVKYNMLEFTYDNKEMADIVEWTEKRIDNEICAYLQRHLHAHSITPSNVEGVQVVVGGDHGDTAFQFGASVSVQLVNIRVIHFELVCCELICRKDTGKLIEATILPTLTDGLKITATWYLHIEKNEEEGRILCEFKETQQPQNSHLAKIYVTGDLAFQAMALGKESMAGWWCMLCKASKAQILNKESEIWTISDLVEAGEIAENSNDDPKLGQKKKPWWNFIPLTNYMSPLLHCEIGIGNMLLELFREAINEHIEHYAPGKKSIRVSIPVLQEVISKHYNKTGPVGQF